MIAVVVDRLKRPSLTQNADGNISIDIEYSYNYVTEPLENSGLVDDVILELFGDDFEEEEDFDEEEDYDDIDWYSPSWEEEPEDRGSCNVPTNDSWDGYSYRG